MDRDPNVLVVLGEIKGRVEGVAGDVSEIKGDVKGHGVRLAAVEGHVTDLQKWRGAAEQSATEAKKRAEKRRERLWQATTAVLSAGALGQIVGVWQWAAHATGMVK